MSGRLIAVVGPSGVGKDTVMNAMIARDPRLRRARRTITRPGEAGGEDFAGASPDAFAAAKAAGAFALSWGAHGLFYGIPRSVETELSAGHDVLANLSRDVLQTASERFARLAIICLTADPEVLASRLSARGRESAGDIADRLRRSTKPLPDHLDILMVDNSGPLDQTVEAALGWLYPVRA